jgi:hypothetical protein
MSMDLAVWSERPFELPRQLPHADSWNSFGEEFAFEGDGWQITVLCASPPPDQSVTSKLPAARHVAYVTLEPIGADPVGYTMLEEVTRGLSRQTGGVWVAPDGEAYFHDEGAF